MNIDTDTDLSGLFDLTWPLDHPRSTVLPGERDPEQVIPYSAPTMPRETDGPCLRDLDNLLDRARAALTHAYVMRDDRTACWRSMAEARTALRELSGNASEVADLLAPKVSRVVA